MTFKDTKYLFSKSQLSLITAALTDNLELPDVLRSVSKRIIDIDNELESCVWARSFLHTHPSPSYHITFYHYLPTPNLKNFFFGF